MGWKSAQPNANVDYNVIINCLISVWGGTGVSVTVKDSVGTTIVGGISGPTPLSLVPLESGWAINFGNFGAAPTCRVVETRF